jgi:uncharacterized protein (TIGR02145 family)
MSELRIGTATSEPATGTLKVGSTDVQEIYLGSTKIWPVEAPPPEEIQLGNLIWKTANYNELDGGNISFANNVGEAWNYYNSQTPAANYFGFAPSGGGGSDRGYLYNIYVARTITPPSGFRLPTENDLNALYTYLRSQTSEPLPRITNIGGGNPNFWSSGVLANSEFGKSGFNAIDTGYMALNSSNGWISNNFKELFWDQTSSSNNPTSTRLFSIVDRGSYIDRNSQGTSRALASIRFCKDA